MLVIREVRREKGGLNGRGEGCCGQAGQRRQLDLPPPLPLFLSLLRLLCLSCRFDFVITCVFEGQRAFYGARFSEVYCFCAFFLFRFGGFVLPDKGEEEWENVLERKHNMGAACVWANYYTVPG